MFWVLSVFSRELTHIFEKADDLIMLLGETCRMKRAVIDKKII